MFFATVDISWARHNTKTALTLPLMFCSDDKRANFRSLVEVLLPLNWVYQDIRLTKRNALCKIHSGFKTFVNKNTILLKFK